MFPIAFAIKKLCTRILFARIATFQRMDPCELFFLSYLFKQIEEGVTGKCYESTSAFCCHGSSFWISRRRDGPFRSGKIDESFCFRIFQKWLPQSELPRISHG